MQDEPNDRPQLSVVLPCYNEAGNLQSLVARFRETLGDRHDIEVILVDNGSTDDTDERLRALISQSGNGFLRTTRVARNVGYGHGIMTGLRAARGAVLAWTHADLQTDPADVLRGLEVLRQQDKPESVFLKGRRRNRPASDTVFTWGMGVLSSLLLGRRLSDINAQPKMFHRTFLPLLAQAPDDFALDLYAYHLALRKGLRLIEIPVYFAARTHGHSKGGGTWRGKMKLTRRTLRYMWSLRQDLRAGRR